MSFHFIQAMQQEGIECKEAIVADGTIHRFSNGKKSHKSAWYVLSEHGGAYGDWRLGISRKWVPVNYSPMTPEQEMLINQKIAEAKQAHQQELLFPKVLL